MFDFCPIVLWRSVRIMNLECPTGQQMQTSYYILIFASNLNDHTSLEFFDVYVPGNKRKQDVSTDLSSTFFQLYFRQEHQQNPNKCILATQYFTSSLRISSRACSLHVKVQCLPKLILQFQPSGSCKTNCIYASLVFLFEYSIGMWRTIAMSLIHTLRFLWS